MKARVALFFAILALCLAFLLPPAAQGQSLSDVLKNMDEAAKTFKSAQGDLTYTKLTAIVNDKSIDKGQFYFERGKKASDLGIRINFKESNGKPSERMILLKGNEGQIYYPKAKQVEIYNVGKNRATVEQFLLLGFGSSGAELQKAYTVALGGEAKVNGEDAVRLDLTPKSAETARQIKSVQLFLSKKTWQPLQQIFNQPGGDYVQAEYGSLKLNSSLPKGVFELRLPNNVKRIRPQG